MQSAAQRRPGVMALVEAAEVETVRQRLRARPAGRGEAVIGCFNGDSSVVQSGQREAVGWVARSLRADGAQVRAVSAGLAAHSPLMREAQDEFNVHLSDVEIAEPAVPVLLNSDGTGCVQPDRIKAELRSQLVTPVRWDSCRATLAALRPDRLIDVGPGAMMAKFSATVAPAVCLNATVSFPEVLRQLTAQVRSAS
jgi:[acyl-carrier-protein] S-malonyltransferase